MVIASKGKAAYLLKGSSKKKRSRAEIEEVKQEEAMLSSNKQEFLRQYKMLKTNHNNDGEMQRNIEKNQLILNKLFEKGVIDADGNIVAGKKGAGRMTDA